MCLHVGSVGIQGGTVRDYFISVFQDWSLIDVNIAEQFIDFASNGGEKFYIFLQIEESEGTSGSLISFSCACLFCS